MYSIRLIKKAKLALSIFQPRFYVTFSHIGQNNRFFSYASRKCINLSSVNASLNFVKYISNYNSMQTNDTDSSDTKDNEKMRKILEDEEFQSILQDFMKDFDVDSESDKLLEDIRKNLDGNPEEKVKSNEDENHCKSNNVPMNTVSGALQLKYKEFSDTDSSIIYSYEEYKYKPLEQNEETYHVDQELEPKTTYDDIKRGITGVFDVEELVHILRKESLLDVTTISISKPGISYADFYVLVTAKSERHCAAVAELIIKLYKKKKSKEDPFVKVEGTTQSNWLVIDMGNIVLHIFLEDTRECYDLESLWLLDSTFDSGGIIQEDPRLSNCEDLMEYFNSLQESQSSELPKDIS